MCYLGKASGYTHGVACIQGNNRVLPIWASIASWAYMFRTSIREFGDVGGIRVLGVGVLSRISHSWHWREHVWPREFDAIYASMKMFDVASSYSVIWTCVASIFSDLGTCGWFCVNAWSRLRSSPERTYTSCITTKASGPEIVDTDLWDNTMITEAKYGMAAHSEASATVKSQGQCRA